MISPRWRSEMRSVSCERIPRSARTERRNENKIHRKIFGKPSCVFIAVLPSSFTLQLLIHAVFTAELGIYMDTYRRLGLWLQHAKRIQAMQSVHTSVKLNSADAHSRLTAWCPRLRYLQFKLVSGNFFVSNFISNFEGDQILSHLYTMVYFSLSRPG